jgi:glucan biosynthesis protein C
MWFIEHLLIFSACYALWRMIRQGRAEPSRNQANPPGYLTVLIFAFGLAVVTTVVRIWFPIDKWVYLLGFVKVAFADVPRDLSFFIIGVLAYRRQWVTRFRTRAGLGWLLVGVIAAVMWYTYALALRSILPISDTAMGILYPIWEMALCCGMCIGLTVLFREKLNLQGRIGKAMAQSQYAAYIFHVPIILLFQSMMLHVELPPFAKFALVTLASVPLTFLFSHWVRKPLRL